LVVTEANTLITPIARYLDLGIYESEEEKAMTQRCARYTLISQYLYRRGYSKPLLKCVTEEQVKYILQEIRKGVSGSHF